MWQCHLKVEVGGTPKKKGERPGEKEDMRPEMVFGKGAHTLNRAMVNEKIGGITASGRTGQGRVCQN